MATKARERSEVEGEIATLQAKLKARQGKPGLAANVAEISKRMDACKFELAALDEKAAK